MNYPDLPALTKIALNSYSINYKSEKKVLL
jgi:hypothetical protein